MKIESYDVAMQSQNSFVQTHESYKNATFATQKIQEDVEKGNSINLLSFESLRSKKVVFNSEDSLSLEDKIKKRIIELLLEQISHRHSRIRLYPHDQGKTHVENTPKTHENPYVSNGQNTRTAWGFLYESKEEYYQKSSVSFSSSATIKTSAGEISLNLNLSYSQEFYELHQTTLQMGEINLMDPLLINYDNNETSFDNISRDMSFHFDINSDGQKDEIPVLKEGVGFLALDKNQNGEIDDGNELFGANTGDGFEELRAYDEDGNNWIDENDPIFNNLRVWEVNDKGENSLISLAQAGVGAIYLSSIDTAFNYSKAIGQDYAKLKESSIFLKENGEAGVVTSVDFAV